MWNETEAAKGNLNTSKADTELSVIFISML